MKRPLSLADLVDWDGGVHETINDLSYKAHTILRYLSAIIGEIIIKTFIEFRVFNNQPYGCHTLNFV